MHAPQQNAARMLHLPTANLPLPHTPMLPFHPTACLQAALPGALEQLVATAAMGATAVTPARSATSATTAPQQLAATAAMAAQVRGCLFSPTASSNSWAR